MIKLFEDFNKRDEIESLCEQYLKVQYTINDDLTVDVHGNVDIANLNLREIPIKFGKVKGDFNCRNNNLTSLANSPNIVMGRFNCNHNKELSSLKGGPIFVMTDFNCSYCNLIDLKYLPKIIYNDLIAYNNKISSLNNGDFAVGRDIDLTNNLLKDLNGIQNKIHGDLDLTNNLFINLKSFPERIDGRLSVYKNKLKSLKGDLKYVDSFDGADNKISSLENNFIEINTLSLGNNKITSFKHCPKNLYILNLYDNKLSTFNDVDNINVSQIIILTGNNLTTLKNIPNMAEGYDIQKNPLPSDILNLKKDEFVKFIKHQDEYSIWNTDGSFNQKRFEIYIKDNL